MLPKQICNFKKQVFHSHNIQSICPRLIKGLRCTVEVSVNAGSRSAPSCLLNYNYVLVLCSTYLRQSTTISIFVQIKPCTSTFFNYNFALVLCSTYLRHLLLVFLSKCNLVPVPLFDYNYVLALFSTYLRQLLLVFCQNTTLYQYLCSTTTMYQYFVQPICVKYYQYFCQN